MFLQISFKEVQGFQKNGRRSKNLQKLYVQLTVKNQLVLVDNFNGIYIVTKHKIKLNVFSEIINYLFL